AGPARRFVRTAVSTPAVTESALARESGSHRRVLRGAVAAAGLLLVVPWVVPPYTAILLTYGLIMAIGALGFNLLLGYTGLLSFGHSAYFGGGAYVVALMVKYVRVGSMELFLLGAIIGSAIVTAVFGWVCVRYTRIFFSILTNTAVTIADPMIAPRRN